ncbi:hypothetical protein ACLB2K_009799 [Fragaria x ananassa]
MRFVQYPFTPVLCWPHDKKVPAAQWSPELVRDLFKSADKNGDGKLSKEELKAAFRRLGSRWSSYRARRALRHVDANGDGVISNEELNDLINYALQCGSRLKFRGEEQVRQLFKSFDRNGDGKLCKEELKDAFRKLGSRWSSFRARRALRYVDSNDDGHISKEEFNDLVNYALECG